jgi:hypothetical protein
VGAVLVAEPEEAAPAGQAPALAERRAGQPAWVLLAAQLAELALRQAQPPASATAVTQGSAIEAIRQ